MNRTPERGAFGRSLELFERASRVIPGGIYGHASPALTVPGEFPYFAARAEGCRYWDADGREYLDFMCGYGPVVLGYRHPQVEAAAAQQAGAGDCFNHPHEVMVALAERLVSLVDFAGWAVFAKNGSDVTTWATRVARESTGRRKILTVRDAYHGAQAWSSPNAGGLLPEDRAHVHAFAWNDLDALRDLARRHRGDVAALIATPYHHPTFGDSELPAPGFWAGVQETCRRDGILLILDDVRAGFRLHLGGSHRLFGFEPDLICFSKALGNGYAISAALGREALKAAASRVFLTGSFWQSAVAMRAALATLEILEQVGAPGLMRRTGERLQAGLRERAARQGLAVGCSGPGALPYMRFADDPDWQRQRRFCAAMVARGVYLHPHHNWFMSTAHAESDVDRALAAAEEAFAAVKAA